MNKLRNYFAVLGALAVTVMSAQTIPTVYDGFKLDQEAHKTLSFDPTGTGEYLPVIWGIDTAWLSGSNTIRGMRHMTPEQVGIVRVSYTPIGLVNPDGTLPDEVKRRLDLRLAECDRLTAARGGNKVQVTLNLDACDVQLRGDYYYVYEGWGLYKDEHWADNYEGWHIDWKKGVKDHQEWANLIIATVKYIQDYGYEVVSIATFNEPDEVQNGLTINHNKQINELLLKTDPELMANIRISGGNTLNCDSAMKWYEFLKEDLREGNTHELAGSFEHYADFFKTVRDNNHWATADELHNTVECMVGAEYGMQTGIWWGTAERTRGEFCQASNTGTRLAYAENRGAWTAASVYESRNKVQAFVGASERQARETSYNFISTRPVYYDGYGPTYSYYAPVAGDPSGAYQTEKQRTAESVFEVEWKEDVRPLIDGTYFVVNKSSGKSVSFDTSSTNTNLVLKTYDSTDDGQKWRIGKVSYDMGGDYAYYYINSYINNGLSWNLFNFYLSENFDPAEDKDVAPIYAFPNGTFNDASKTIGIYDINMEWWLDYDGDGWFHIISKTSGYCVKNLQGKTDDGTILIQAPYSKDDPTQKFRLIKAEGAPAAFSLQAPDAPTDVVAVAQGSSVKVSWQPVSSAAITGYSLLRKDSRDDYFSVIARDLQGSEILDNTTMPGETYVYKVVAHDNCGNRSQSAEATATTNSGKMALTVLPLYTDMNDISGNGHHARAFEPGRFRTSTAQGISFYNVNSPRAALTLPPSAVGQGDEFTVSLNTQVLASALSIPTHFAFSFGTDSLHTISFCINNGSKMMELSSCNGGEYKRLTAPKPQDRSLVHLAVTIAPDCWTIYVNGAEVGKLEEPGLSEYLPDVRTANYIGRNIASQTYRERDGYQQTHSLLSNLYNVHIYNYALSPEEVLADKNGQVAAIGAITSDNGRQVLRRETYNVAGQRVPDNTTGEPVIIRITYTDQSVETRKEMR